jgi:hypothetical protein
VFLSDSKSIVGDEKHSSAAQKVGGHKSSDEILGLFDVGLSNSEILSFSDTILAI